MRINIIYGIKITGAARAAIRSELLKAGCEVVDDSIVREIKNGIDQMVEQYAKEEQLVLILAHSLERTNPFTSNDLLRYQKNVPNIKIILVVSEDMKGSMLLKDMSDNGMYLAIYNDETSAPKIRELIMDGRTVEKAKQHYGVKGMKSVPKQMTLDSAVTHMTAPVKNNKEYYDRAKWIKSVLASEDSFVAVINKLPDEIKDVLAQNKAYYTYVEDYVIKKAGAGVKADEKSGGGLLGKFRSKKNKEEKRERAEVEKMAVVEELEAEADRRAELERQEAERIERERLEEESRAAREKLEAERKAEADRIEAERKAELDRLEAERKAEQEKLEAERLAERERKEAEKKAEKERREAEKAAERERKEAEREIRWAEQEKERMERAELEEELALLKRQQEEERAREDALRRERLRIEAEEKAKAEIEYKREVDQQRRAEAERKVAEKAAAKAERSASGARTGIMGMFGGGVSRGSGREDVCVFSLRHGTGTSYVAASMANFFAKNRSGDVSVVMSDTEYLDEIIAPRINVLPWAREGEAFINSNYIVHDIGVYSDMSSDRKISLQRASMKILLCKADGRYMSRLASFVESNDTSDIIFLFNELPPEWEKRVYNVMDFTKNVYCIPTFFSLAPSAQVIKVYNDIFKRK